ncbi:hypothetical protein [Ramlibacter sp. AN1133]|uniref:hypothetical protein n=1 Tax=Ramlibacter sp. AN1133 TaxID=3133429 RepID=UPI0030C4F6A8
MKHTINRIRLSVFAATAHAVASPATPTRASARIGFMLGTIVGPSLAGAQGFITGFQNLNSLGSQVVALLTVIGLVGGLGMILGGLFSAYKKYDNRGGDDGGWGKIAVQIGAGGLGMALGWVGTNVVATMGGSASDIGKSLR